MPAERELKSSGDKVVRKRALIVKFGQIGDVIMAVPAAAALYARGYEIEWICGKAVRSLLECYSWVRVIPVDDAAILRGRLLERAKAIVALWASTASTRYDISATLYYDRRFHLLTLPIRARRRVVLSRQSRAHALLAGRRHPDEYMRILLQYEDSCRDESSALVRPDQLPGFCWPDAKRSKRIAIVPGGTKNVVGEQVLRRWPIENYERLAGRLLERGWEVVLIGGSDDAWIRPHLQHLPVTDLIGRYSLPEVLCALDDCDAVVSHDTGPLHLAGLSKAALIGLFGPTDPAVFQPRRPFSTAILGGHGFACRPCYDGRNFAPCRFNGCMHQVSPELVLRELDRLLNDRDHGKTGEWRIVVPEGNEVPLHTISIADSSRTISSREE